MNGVLLGEERIDGVLLGPRGEVLLTFGDEPTAESRTPHPKSKKDQTEERTESGTPGESSSSAGVASPTTPSKENARTWPEVRDQRSGRPLPWVPRYLDALSLIGIPGVAAAEVGIDRSTPSKLKDRDPVFAQAYDQAIQASIELAEREVVRRGITGWDEPVFGPIHDENGKRVSYGQIGTKRMYDRVLLMFWLNGQAPEKYRKRLDITTDENEIDREIAALRRTMEKQAATKP